MAGYYSDVVGNRIPYDKDGTVGMTYSSAGVLLRTFTGAEMILLNDDGATGPSATNMIYTTLVFPALRDITHFTLWYSNPGTITCMSSTNTTNGWDGTWNSVGGGSSTYVDSAWSAVSGRTSPSAQVALTSNNTGIKAIRWAEQFGNRQMTGLHLFGKATTQVGLEMWHPTLDQALRLTPAYLDWGDKARGSAAEVKSFRIKNHSAQTANTITVSFEESAANTPSPTMASQHSLRYNGGTYGTTATITSLAAGAVSQLVDLRQTVSSTAVLALWNQRVVATAASFS